MSATTPPSSSSSSSSAARTIGEEAIRDVEREWAEIFATLRAEMEAGTDPADPKLRPLAQRGPRARSRCSPAATRGSRSSLKRMWENEDPEKVSHGMVDAEVLAYYGKVQAAADSGSVPRIRVFLAGATGAIGRRLVPALLAAGHG